jgi:hypothetical protein
MLPEYDRVDGNFRGDLNDKWSLEQCRSGTGCHFHISPIRSAFCARFVHEGSPRHGLLGLAPPTPFTLKSDNRADGYIRRKAKSLESAADSVRAAGNEGASAISDLTNEAGQRLDSTATYFRGFAGGNLLRELRHKVGQNPPGSLALAGRPLVL